MQSDNKRGADTLRKTVDMNIYKTQIDNIQSESRIEIPDMITKITATVKHCNIRKIAGYYYTSNTVENLLDFFYDGVELKTGPDMEEVLDISCMDFSMLDLNALTRFREFMLDHPELEGNVFIVTEFISDFHCPHYDEKDSIALTRFSELLTECSDDYNDYILIPVCYNMPVSCLDGKQEQNYETFDKFAFRTLMEGTELEDSLYAFDCNGLLDVYDI